MMLFKNISLLIATILISVDDNKILEYRSGSLSLAMMSLLCAAVVFLSKTKKIKKVMVMKLLTDFLFVFLLRSENLPDLRKEVGAWCPVWLFSGGAVRQRLCWGRSVLLSSASHTGPDPWGSTGCWAPLVPPTTGQDWGKSEATKSWRWNIEMDTWDVHFVMVSASFSKMMMTVYYYLYHYFILPRWWCYIPNSFCVICCNLSTSDLFSLASLCVP